MADTVNPQITDSVTEINTEVLGLAPAMAMGQLYQATAQALSNAAHNATVAQNAGNALTNASTGVAVAVLGKLATQAAG
jgi:hypothetical protein